MPFTPLHFGYGALAHALAPKRISFLAFCAANVVVDLEPLFYMLSGQYPLHRFLHTFPGATLAALGVVLLHALAARPAVARRLPDWWGWRSLTHGAVAVGAFVGTYSHVALDGVMHDDVRPFAPFSSADPFLWLVSVDRLHLSCVAAALLSLPLLAWHRRRLPAVTADIADR